MTEKRFEGEEDSDYIRDNKTDERALYLCDWLNKLNKLSNENEQLKKLISKIDFALIRKYDNSLENILDEVYDGESTK